MSISVKPSIGSAGIGGAGIGGAGIVAETGTPPVIDDALLQSNGTDFIMQDDGTSYILIA